LFRVLGYPPQDLAEDFPLGCVADVEGKIFRIGRDKKIGAGEALKASDFESEVSMSDND
jgi:hypothetical protein